MIINHNEVITKMGGRVVFLMQTRLLETIKPSLKKLEPITACQKKLRSSVKEEKGDVDARHAILQRCCEQTIAVFLTEKQTQF